MARKEQDYLAQERCGNCRYWRRLDDVEQMPEEDVLGECHRYPPVIVSVEGEQALPICEAQHWCGEHGRSVN